MLFIRASRTAKIPASYPGINFCTDPKAERPREKCVHELFEEQAARTPEAVAVVFGQDQVRYRELDERAEDLAGHLRALGVGPDALVGICVERSVEMIVGLLGILKAGGAYVPLDPTHPKDRLSLVLEDTGLRVLATQSRLIPLLPPHRAEVVVLDGPPPAGETARPIEKPRAANLAYVMHTSGSTGRPKGVCVPHRGVTRLVKNTDYARFAPDETFLQLAPLAFDASTFEIWGALLNGAKLVVHPPRATSLAELGSFIEQNQITTLWLTAGLFSQMVEDQAGRLKSVRQLLAGGDVLPAAQAGKALARLPNCRLINGYGPTESTTFACCHDVTSADAERGRIPIGRPVANTSVFILDEGLRPVAPGEPGELHLGGDGLARGYLNLPELTAEKFIPNPFGDEMGDRLYKTGDLGRHRPDGNIEFLGRMDDQVKIRGFRVELGEIEAVLHRHPGVRQAVVTARTDGLGDRRLSACIVPVEPAHGPEPAELRDFLKATLPDYMMPGSFAVVERLPLTANGKVDRNALPTPAPSRSGRAGEAAAPRTSFELAVSRCWAQAVGSSEPGARNNFFEAGGNSLGALRLLAEVDKLFGTKVSLADFYQNPTFSGLAELAERARPGGAANRVFTAGSTGEKPPLFILDWLGMARYLGQIMAPERKVFGVESPLEDGVKRGRAEGRRGLSIEELAARDLAAIRREQPQGPYHLAGLCLGGTVAFEVARQLKREGERVVSLVIVDAIYYPGYTGVQFHLRRGYHRARQAAKMGPGHVLASLSGKIKARARWRPRRNTGLGNQGAPDDGESFRIQLMRQYRGGPYDGPVLLFVSSKTLGAESTHGWDRLILRDLQTTAIDCLHDEIYQEPRAGEVARRIMLYLSRIEAGSKLVT